MVVAQNVEKDLNVSSEQIEDFILERRPYTVKTLRNQIDSRIKSIDAATTTTANPVRYIIFEYIENMGLIIKKDKDEIQSDYEYYIYMPHEIEFKIYKGYPENSSRYDQANLFQQKIDAQTGSTTPFDSEGLLIIDLKKIERF